MLPARQLTITISWTEAAWADELDPRDPEFPGPTEDEVLEYYRDYAQGADMSDGISYEASWVDVAS